MRQKIVIANIKMNLSVPESTVLFEKYKQEINPERTEVVVCPSYLDIYSAEGIFQGTSIKVGAQDVFYEDQGQYTGEVSPDQLKGFADYVIVGHSERRKNFGETDKVVAKKAAAAVRHGLVPIICVGENLHEKMDGLTKLVVAGQVEADVDRVLGRGGVAGVQVPPKHVTDRVGRLEDRRDAGQDRGRREVPPGSGGTVGADQ